MSNICWTNRRLPTIKGMENWNKLTYKLIYHNKIILRMQILPTINLYNIDGEHKRHVNYNQLMSISPCPHYVRQTNYLYLNYLGKIWFVYHLICQTRADGTLKGHITMSLKSPWILKWYWADWLSALAYCWLHSTNSWSTC